MSDIVAFITARLDDLEGFLSTTPDEVEWIGDRFVAIRTLLLADVEAKRRIVELADEASDIDQSLDAEFIAAGSRDLSKDPYVGERILRALALPWANHPDYDERWKP